MRVALVIEGLRTNDGRLVQEGASTWPERINVLDVPELNARIVGHVTDIRRAGGWVTGEYEGPLHPDQALTVNARPDAQSHQSAASEMYVFTHYPIAAAVLSPLVLWPWPQCGHREDAGKPFVLPPTEVSRRVHTEETEDRTSQIEAFLTNTIGGMAALVRPPLMAAIREVLERNSGIVDQRAEALDHLTAELADTLFPAEGLGGFFGALGGS